MNTLKKPCYNGFLRVFLGGYYDTPLGVQSPRFKISENESSIEQSETRGIIRELSMIEQSETHSLAGHEVTCSAEQRGRKLSAPLVFDFTFFKKVKPSAEPAEHALSRSD